MKKLKTFFAVLFLIAGIFMLGISSLIKMENVNFMKTAKKTDALVTSISRNYDSGYGMFDDYSQYTLFSRYSIDINYEVNGKSYVGYLQEFSRYGLHKGDSMTIYYDPANPYNFRRDSKFEWYFLICIVVGIGLIVVSMSIKGSALYNQMREKQYKKFKIRGRKVMADINNITMDAKYSKGNSHLYYVTCSYQDPMTNCLYTFRSKGIQSEKDLEIFAEIQNITSLPVYMDEKNPKKYMVDMEKFKSCTYNQCYHEVIK